jgi:hypothetical protein
MSSEKEKIAILNQLMGMIDSAATGLKSDYKKMKPVQFMAQKKSVLETIQSALQVASEIKANPSVKEVITDLNQLSRQINSLKQG